MIVCRQITENKWFELQTVSHSKTWAIGFEIRWCSEGDHPGLYTELSFFGFWMELNLYDGRHAEPEDAT